MEYVAQVYQKYAVFEGRARRKEYWSFMAFSFSVIFALQFMLGLAGDPDEMSPLHLTTEAILAIFALATVVPSLAVRVRRLHDINQTGYWALIAILPIVGELLLIVFALIPGTRGGNRFGEDPKVIGDDPDVAQVFT